MTFRQLIGEGSTGVIGVLNTIAVPVIFTLAAFVFVWGVLKYFFWHGGNEEKRAEGRQFVLWGILGMVLMFSVWGVVNMLLSTLGLSN